MNDTGFFAYIFDMQFPLQLLHYAAILFVFAIGLLILFIAVLYIVDITQTRHAVRRNYPVIGRFRYWFEDLGEFFRQYFFAQDREEMPFNRAQRIWVYRSAKNLDSTVAFGSTRSLRDPGTLLFVNDPFPVLARDFASTSEVIIGPDADKPYAQDRIFNVSGMSYGAISKPAVLALSNGARMAGCWMNTGEGGLSPWHLEGGADVIFQLGTAKYGARDADGKLDDVKLKALAAHDAVRMFEIKLSQGAKPGKGGILPGIKVTREIAAIRGISVGEDSISPNRHVDIESNDELLDMINRVRDVTGKPTGFKAVLGSADWPTELCETILRRGPASAPDFITVDSADGGTGAAPQSLIDYVGLPLNESLPMLVDILEQAGLKQRIKVISSGKLVTPDGVAWALCVGADFVTSARGFMFALGCIQAMQCNRDTCPTGITTHNKRLQRGLVPKDKAARVNHYATNVEKEISIIAHSCGVAEPRLLDRSHARLVLQADERSLALADLYARLPQSRIP